jgi:hypothetical protein
MKVRVLIQRGIFSRTFKILPLLPTLIYISNAGDLGLVPPDRLNLTVDIEL